MPPPADALTRCVVAASPRPHAANASSTARLRGGRVDELGHGAIVEVQHGLHTVSEMREPSDSNDASLGRVRPRLPRLSRRHRRRAGAVAGDAGGCRRVRRHRGPVGPGVRFAGAVDRRRQPGRRSSARPLRRPVADARRLGGDDGGQCGRRRRRRVRRCGRRPSTPRRRRRAVLPGRAAGSAGRRR